MNEPSDPQRPSGGDRPRETAAFEDTEFSFGDAASRSGFTADVVENKDDNGNATDGSVVDADVVGEEALGHTSDPEMTGIIPAIRDDSPRPADLAAPAAAEVPAEAAEASVETTAGGGDGDDGTDDERSGFRRIPPWGWILVVGAVLAVVVGLVTAALMRGNSTSGPAPLTSVQPNYERPEAWNGEESSPSADVPTADQGYGFDPYSDGLGNQTWDSGTTGDSGGDWDNDENVGPTDTTDDGAGDTGDNGPETGAPGGDGDDPDESGTPGTDTPGGGTGDTGGAGDTGDTGGETTE
ncbi:hypothetical protein [Corynebacterium sp.]|jgi:hypothetical protein|uniref:hypothetical protein n=1 Tax=Corynebacterium sp. TaxID=1720 RepID=UPI0025C260A1|nr:hypothetical protein [Corynebacterium sp.]